MRIFNYQLSVIFRNFILLYTFSFMLLGCTKEDILDVLLSDLTIKNPPSVVFYYVGDTLSLDGLIVTVSYSDGTISDVAYSDFSTSGFISSISDGAILSASDSTIVISNSDGSLSVDQVIIVISSIPEPIYGSLTDRRDGNSYATVQIGDQVWMAENLEYYIDSVDYNSDGTVDLEDIHCWDNGEYGKLYTWEAAKQVCPEGWHLPSDNEWDELESYLIANGYNYDGSTSGDKVAKSLASKTSWYSSDNIGDVGNSPSTNNSTGFNALPGGYCHYYGSHGYAGYLSCWWSSLDISNYYAYGRNLYYKISYLYRFYSYKYNGMSVRCIKD